ncbi:MAG: tRNA pseudouridine(38-40) synthase TruA [Bacteroides sp.]|nr:tRNA pseudouridine(38-40) synthase TruA [Bacteroides sp.]MCM1379700.1 tRNA pseudouridine(38-40) synthase TruA [Bacteroides sp.]MCM1446055.1 tRNA pseudouridine(38-40) synthase TruA [Prevotella sp.]
MPRYFMTLAYRGEPFHGWQSQPGERTVQSELERALSTILRTPTTIVGAGRTDAGVNASMMVAHFDAPHLPEPRAINALVAPDIVVSEIRQVADDAHARFDATSRTYHYRALEHRSPFLYPLAWFTRPLNYVAMNQAAALLLQTDDFTSFAKLHSDAKTNICRVTRAEWVSDPATGGMTFIITANRFLRNMVRAVVGTLVEVGRGKMTVDEFADVIAAKNRCSAGTSMPAHALYLADITYPY